MSAAAVVRPARLHRHPIHVRGPGFSRLLQQTSLFPFFGRDQVTRYLMLIGSLSADIVLLPWAPDLARVPLLGAVRLTITEEALLPASREDLKQLRGLWHFDPWWVLADERFVGHAAVPDLKRTNTIEHVAGTTWRFTRDLGRLGPAGAAEDLPAPPPPAPGGWRLDPVWTRWTVGL